MATTVPREQMRSPSHCPYCRFGIPVPYRSFDESHCIGSEHNDSSSLQFAGLAVVGCAHRRRRCGHH